MKRSILTLAAMILLLNNTPQSASATTIFSDFGAGQSFTSGVGMSVSNNFYSSTVSSAVQFTVTGGDATVTQIQVAVFGSGQLQGVLLADNGNSPGTVLETFSTFSPPSTGYLGNGTILTASAPQNVVLLSGQKYWLALENIQSGGDFGWNWAPTGGTVAETNGSIDSGWQTFSGNYTRGAFEIDGTPTTSATPEPSTLVLLGGIGIGGIGSYSWRRRRQSA